MDKEENSSDIKNNDETNVTPTASPSDKGIKGGIPAKRVVKTKRRTKRRGIKPEVLIAIIGAIAAITVALIEASKNQSDSTPTSVPVTVPIFTNTFATSLSATPTDTQIPKSTLTFTPTNTSTATATEVPTSTPSNTMVVILTASRNTGRPPLAVKFDARDSYLREPTGRQLSCRGGQCYYTWRVYSSAGQIDASDDNSSGTFDYNFSRKGSYRVTVLICRGKDRIDCGDGGVLIEVTR